MSLTDRLASADPHAAEDRRAFGKTPAAAVWRGNRMSENISDRRETAFPGPFNDAFERVIGHEDGYVNDPADPGGETKFGISAKAYPELNIKTLTMHEAKAIYFSDYWDATGCNMLPAGLAYAVFDAAVNAGVGRAKRWLQEAVGTVPDGVVGPATRAAIKRAMRDPLAVLEMLNAIRLKHYMSLSHMTGRFGLGWSRRVLQVHTTALALSGGAA